MTDWRGGAKLRARVPARERRCVRRVLVCWGEGRRWIGGWWGWDYLFELLPIYIDTAITSGLNFTLVNALEL